MPAARRRLAAVPEAPGRVVLYRRVSALMGRGGDDFHSPDLQAAALRRHIASLGLREVGVVDDIDVSGRTFSRDGLDRIVVMVEAGQVDAVAVYDLSRLGRNAGEALRFIKFLREHRVSIISTVEKIDDSPEGQFILTQFLALAELYSNQIGRRWAEVIAHRVRQGRHHGGIPLGYQRQDGELVVDPVIGPAITEAFRMYATDEPIMAISKMISRVRGKRTQIPTMKRVLFNPTYLGKVVIWGIGRHRQPNAHDTPAYIGTGRHERLVDDDTWEKCQERHQRDARTPPRRRVPSNPLAGIVLCAHCERPMQLRAGVARDPATRLLCGSKATTGDCRGAGRPRLEVVVDAVLDKVREHIRLLRIDPVAQAAAVGKTARAGADIARLKRDLADTRTAMAKLAGGWASGKVPDAAYEEAMAPLEAAERELDDRFREASISSEQPAPLEIANIAERMLNAWPKMTVIEKNRALKQVVKRATIRRRAAGWFEPEADRLDVDFW